MNTDPQLEIHLPDEERFQQLTITGCQCGFPARLHMRKAPHGKKRYRIECGVAHRFDYDRESHFKHSDPTPWMSCSQDAIRHWKLVAVLSRV
jgi:hypothetical protein